MSNIKNKINEWPTEAEIAGMDQPGLAKELGELALDESNLKNVPVEHRDLVRDGIDHQIGLLSRREEELNDPVAQAEARAKRLKEIRTGLKGSLDDKVIGPDGLVTSVEEIAVENKKIADGALDRHGNR